MARYSDVNEELLAMDTFQAEMEHLADEGVVGVDTVEAVRTHYEGRRTQLSAAVAGSTRGITRSAATSSTTVPIIAWIGILLVIGAAITTATYVWPNASSWQKVAILLVPAIAAYIISHRLYGRESTKRVGFAVLGGANALFISSLIVAAAEYEWGRPGLNDADVALVIGLIALALCILWIVRLDSDFYRLIGIIVLAFTLSFANNLAWADREAALNDRANVAYSAMDEEFREYEKEVRVNPNAPYPEQSPEILAVEADRQELWKQKSVALTALFAAAGASLVAFGRWLERVRPGSSDERMYYLGGTALFIAGFMALSPEIIPTAFDSLVPLILSLVAVWFGLHTERSAFVLAGLAMFFPTLVLALTGFGDNLAAIAGILATLGALAIYIATRAERYRAALLDSISGRNIGTDS